MSGLGVTLVEKVKEIAARIVGVERIVFFYRQEVVMRVQDQRASGSSI